MANLPAMTDETAEPAVSSAWEAALLDYRRELERRGSSRHTLRAYGGDLAELAEWATRQGKEPGSLVYRDLRSYAAALS
jgi:site-specific recombinase XerD